MQQQKALRLSGMLHLVGRRTGKPKVLRTLVTGTVHLARRMFGEDGDILISEPFGAPVFWGSRPGREYCGYHTIDSEAVTEVLGLLSSYMQKVTILRNLAEDVSTGCKQGDVSGGVSREEVTVPK